MEHHHIHKAFDQDLNALKDQLQKMFEMTADQLLLATKALKKSDLELAKTLNDKPINELELSIDGAAVQLIALRQPVARDLRASIVPIKIAADLERIGDHAKAIAKRQRILSTSSLKVPSVKPLIRMSRITQEMLANARTAYHNDDAELAAEIIERDTDVDEMYSGLFREMLTYMMEDPRKIEGCMHLLFIARSFERIGDHMCNISEQVHYLVHGTIYEES